MFLAIKLQNHKVKHKKTKQEKFRVKNSFTLLIQHLSDSSHPVLYKLETKITGMTIKLFFFTKKKIFQIGKTFWCRKSFSLFRGASIRLLINCFLVKKRTFCCARLASEFQRNPLNCLNECMVIQVLQFLAVVVYVVNQMKHTKQIFHAFLFNIRNYSPEELHIILLRVNNFDIKQKRHGIFVLLYTTNTKQDLGR